MKKRLGDTSSAMPWIKQIVIGSLAGIAVIIIILMLLALVISFGILPVSSCPAMASIALAIGGFTSGFISAKKHGKNGLVVGALCGTLLFIIFTLIGLAAFKSSPGGATLIRLLIFLTSSSVGGIVGVGNGSKRKIV